MNLFLLSWGIHVLLSLDIDASGPWTLHFDLGLHSTGLGDFGFLLKWQPWLSGQLIKGPFCPYHYFSPFCLQNHFPCVCLYPAASASFFFLGTCTNKSKDCRAAEIPGNEEHSFSHCGILDEFFNLDFKTLRSNTTVSKCSKIEEFQNGGFKWRNSVKKSWYNGVYIRF